MTEQLPNVIITEDGSSTLEQINLKETYHSIHGAMNESMHIFINAGLKECSLKNQTINILEIGFGTGLNALLSLVYSIAEEIKINYVSIEPFPISNTTIKELNYPDMIGGNSKELFFSIHNSEWNQPVFITDDFILNKILTSIQDVELSLNAFDVVYFDAFSPEVQPEMWTTDVFKKLFSAIKPNGILVTYSAKGQIKRNLKECGFIVEPIAGPKGKREITRARKHLLADNIR
ncbi:MAG: tRNA (5-methylaminomethyl-2-thiouridine)(34)-methyltransferase MnmD [Bacteroidota bacterium]